MTLDSCGFASARPSQGPVEIPGVRTVRAVVRVLQSALAVLGGFQAVCQKVSVKIITKSALSQAKMLHAVQLEGITVRTDALLSKSWVSVKAESNGEPTSIGGIQLHLHVMASSYRMCPAHESTDSRVPWIVSLQTGYVAFDCITAWPGQLPSTPSEGIHSLPLPNCIRFDLKFEGVRASLMSSGNRVGISHQDAVLCQL